MKLEGKDAVELAQMEFPAPLPLLSPWLTAPSVGMLYGWRGTGKSFFALAIASCVAGGGKFLAWEAKAPSRVAYVDGELGMAVIKERQRLVVMGADYEFEQGHLSYLTFEHTRGIIPNLANRDWQQHYSEYLKNKHLAIFDHISAVVRPEGKESDVDAWARVQDWAIREREKGKAILFIHHAGKSGTQRGTSTREDCLDYVIALRRPPRYEMKHGCTFELHFEKTRHFFGADAEPLLCSLKTDDDGHLYWTHSPLGESRDTEILELKEEGLSANDIATILHMEVGRVKLILSKQLPDRRNNGNTESDIFAKRSGTAD